MSGPLASGATLGETCIDCLHDNQNIDKNSYYAKTRFRTRLIVMLVTGLRLGFITEKLCIRTFIIPGPSSPTYGARYDVPLEPPLVGPECL